MWWSSHFTDSLHNALMRQVFQTMTMYHPRTSDDPATVHFSRQRSCDQLQQIHTVSTSLKRQQTYLVSSQHAVKPRQELLGAVVRVKYHGDTIEFCHLSHVQSHRYGACDGGLFLGFLVVDAFTGEESGTTVRRLQFGNDTSKYLQALSFGGHTTNSPKHSESTQHLFRK